MGSQLGAYMSTHVGAAEQLCTGSREQPEDPKGLEKLTSLQKNKVFLGSSWKQIFSCNVFNSHTFQKIVISM